MPAELEVGAGATGATTGATTGAAATGAATGVETGVATGDDALAAAPSEITASSAPTGTVWST